MTRRLENGADLRGPLQVAGAAGSSGQLFESQGSSTYPKWGRLITTSVSDPTGGSDGDIWIKYTA
jgi:hypothetical protein